MDNINTLKGKVSHRHQNDESNESEKFLMVETETKQTNPNPCKVAHDTNTPIRDQYQVACDSKKSNKDFISSVIQSSYNSLVSIIHVDNAPQGKELEKSSDVPCLDNQVHSQRRNAITEEEIAQNVKDLENEMLCETLYDLGFL